MPVSAATFERLALEDEDGQWEMVRGCPRRKPDMTHEHNSTARILVAALIRQLPGDKFEVSLNAGYASRTNASYFIPDVMAIPVKLVRGGIGSRTLERYSGPLPFVAEVWSPSTGEYDVDEKFPEYQRQGDLEIWRVHPYEKMITAWRRQPDGSCTETLYASGAAPVESLGVSVVLGVALPLAAVTYARPERGAGLDAVPRYERRPTS